MGKGDKRRPSLVSTDKYEKNYNKIFGENKMSKMGALILDRLSRCIQCAESVPGHGPNDLRCIILNRDAVNISICPKNDKEYIKASNEHQCPTKEK